MLKACRRTCVRSSTGFSAGHPVRPSRPRSHVARVFVGDARKARRDLSTRRMEQSDLLGSGQGWNHSKSSWLSQRPSVAPGSPSTVVPPVPGKAALDVAANNSLSRQWISGDVGSSARPAGSTAMHYNNIVFCRQSAKIWRERSFILMSKLDFDLFEAAHFSMLGI